MDNRPGTLSLRHSSAVWVPAVMWSFCLFVLVDAVVEGTVGYAIRVGLLMAAAAFIVFVTLAKPALLLDNEGITVANVLRTHRIPFGALIDIRVGGLMSVVARTAEGERKITSWNAPGAKRRPTSGESEIERLIRNCWESWLSQHPGVGPETVTSSWNKREGIIVIGMIAVNIAIRLR